MEKTPGAGLVMNQFHYVRTRPGLALPPWIAWWSGARWWALTPAATLLIIYSAAPPRCREEKVRWLDRCPATGKPPVESSRLNPSLAGTLLCATTSTFSTEPAEEVRHLTRTHGEPLRPLWLGARAAGPLVALLTASRALVWQENEHQLRPGAAARQRPVRRPAASRPFAGSS